MAFRRLGFTALAVALVASVSAAAPADAQSPAKRIGPSRLHALLLSNDEIRAALPTITIPFEMNGGICMQAEASETAGLGPINGCQNTLTMESSYAHEQTPDEPFPQHIAVQSFPSSAAAKKGLAEQLRTHQGHGWKVFDASSSGFAASMQSDQYTEYYALKGATLVAAACWGRAPETRLACTKALSTAQKHKLP